MVVKGLTMSSIPDEEDRLQRQTSEMLILIHSKKWGQVKKRIFFNKSIVAKCHGRCESTYDTNHTALHIACQFRPPLDVIKALYKAHPEAIFEADCKGQYVLHVACEHGCTPEVVQYLLEKNTEAASKSDIKGRTPLLLAYKSYVYSCCMPWKIANSMLLKVGKILTKADPSSITQEDNEGLAAIEYGINGEYLHPTLVVLQKAVTRYQRER